jgi:polyisoprenoid-binding protein YceI
VKEADSIMSRRLRTAVFMPFVAFCSLAGLPGLAQTQTWYLDPPHSSAQFSVRHMGISTVRGAFTKVSGTVEDSPDPAKSSVNVTIDASSIDTRVEMRDKDLRGENFFDVAKYPTITFKSTKVEAAGSGKLKVTGDLTMHGVTKEAVLDVDGPTAPFKDPKGKSHRGLSATTTLIRSNFGITADAGMVGDSVAIQLDVELVDQAPGPPRSGPPPTPPPAGK